MDQYSERCNDPLGRVNLLVIFLVLQTIIVIATLLDKTGGKERGGEKKENYMSLNVILKII